MVKGHSWAVQIGAIVSFIVIIVYQHFKIEQLQRTTMSCNQYDYRPLQSSEFTTIRGSGPSFTTQDEFLRTAGTTLKGPFQRRTQKMFEGVAVTTFLGSPKWFQNRYSMMVNQMLAVIPDNWVVQIFYKPNNKMAKEGTMYPGIQRQVARGRVILTEIPQQMNKIKKNDLMLSPWLWDNMLAENVLLFGGTSVLCANSPLELSEFVGKYTYIGTPWSALNGIGGSGALSLRNRTYIHSVLKDWENSGKNLKGVKEDILLVRSLIDKNINLPPKEVTERFGAMEKLPSQHLANSKGLLGQTLNTQLAAPLGVTGTLGRYDDQSRQHFLDYCPEMKMFFPSLHNPNCFGADPNPIECLKYLCVRGGIKCNKINDQVSASYKDKEQRVVTIEIKVSAPTQNSP